MYSFIHCLTSLLVHLFKPSFTHRLTYSCIYLALSDWLPRDRSFSLAHAAASPLNRSGHDGKVAPGSVGASSQLLQPLSPTNSKQ